MEYVNATYWKRPKEDDATHNTTPPPPGLPMTNIPSSPSLNSTIINPHTYGDCQAWSNEITQLCYDCQSCKQGFISTVHHKWRIHGIFMITMSVILLLVHTPRFILTMMQRSRS